jgi:hypothetical protein
MTCGVIVASFGFREWLPLERENASRGVGTATRIRRTIREKRFREFSLGYMVAL